MVAMKLPWYCSTDTRGSTRDIFISIPSDRRRLLQHNVGHFWQANRPLRFIGSALHAIYTFFSLGSLPTSAPIAKRNLEYKRSRSIKSLIIERSIHISYSLFPERGIEKRAGITYVTSGWQQPRYYVHGMYSKTHFAQQHRPFLRARTRWPGPKKARRLYRCQNASSCVGFSW